MHELCNINNLGAHESQRRYIRDQRHAVTQLLTACYEATFYEGLDQYEPRLDLDYFRMSHRRISTLPTRPRIDP